MAVQLFCSKVRKSEVSSTVRCCSHFPSLFCILPWQSKASRDIGELCIMLKRQTKTLGIPWCCKKVENVTQVQFDSSKTQDLEPTQVYSSEMFGLCGGTA